MKNWFVLLFFLATTAHVCAQFTQTVTPVLDAQAGVLNVLEPKPGGVKGSAYLYEGWIEADLYLKPGVFSTNVIEDVPVKLDIKTNTIEVRTPAGVRVVEGAKVDRFTWINPETATPEEYLNCHQFTTEDTRLHGFCMATGERVKVLRHDYIEVLKANYNVAMDVGSREDQLIKKSELYFLVDGKMIRSGKKTLYSITGDKSADIKKFIKDHRIKVSDEEGLRSVIDYYNSIM